MKLTKKQRQVLAEILVNFAIAWISIATITQLVFKMENVKIAFLRFVIFFVSCYLSIRIVE